MSASSTETVPSEPVPHTDPPRIFRAPEWIWADAGSIGWWVRPEWREHLLGPEGLRLTEWRSHGGLTTVKAGPHRIVYRAELPDHRTVYVKHFLVPTFASILRQWFRRGKGRNEAKRAARLAALGVPTITPLALGEQRKHRFLFENYLVTEEIPGTVPLDVFLEQVLPEYPEAERCRLRRRTIEALGDLTARLHEGGFLHNDFHPGNILVRVEAEGIRLAMIDLDALRVRRRLSTRDAIRNLTLLNHSFWLLASRADRLRFLRAYLRGRTANLEDPRRLARTIEADTRIHAERLWRRWGRRCRGTNKYFAAFRTGEAWAMAHRDLDPSDVNALLADPNAPFHAPGARMLKNSRTTTVIETTLRVRGQATRVIYKRFNRKKRLDPWLTLFRPSRGWRAWLNGQHLLSRGIPTPQNLAVIGHRGHGRFHVLPRDTYLITVKAEPAITLGHYAREVLPRLDPVQRRDAIRRFVPALGRLLRTLHDRSLSHRDLKADNILIEGDPDAPRPTLSLIDLVGVRVEHPISRHHRIQNLARIQLSLASAVGRTRTDALRFLRTYAPRAFGLDASWKELWRNVETASRRKQQRNLMNHRILS